MREYLFRGKRIDNGEWVKGYYIKATRHCHEHGIHEEWIAVDTIQNGGWCNVRSKYAVIPETVGQYTGLTDKNGKEIFEGDVIKYKNTDGIKFNGVALTVIGKVVYNEKNASFAISGKDEIKKIEVIGNIHDNPELLKGGEEE